MQFVSRLLSKIFKVSKTKWTWRWYVISTPWFGVKLHWVRPTLDEWHNHPWNGVSLILWGSYTEQRELYEPFVKRRFINFIGANTPHRTRGNALTLFIHGPRVNENWFWGEAKAPWRGPQTQVEE